MLKCSYPHAFHFYHSALPHLRQNEAERLCPGDDVEELRVVATLSFLCDRCSTGHLLLVDVGRQALHIHTSQFTR